MARPRKAVVEYRIYDLPQQFPIILLDGKDWHISDVKNKRLHFHNCFEIGVCHTDSGTMVFEDAEYHFRAGDVTCVPKHIVHTTFSTKGTKSLWSYLFLDFHRLWGDAVLPQGVFEHNHSNSIDFYHLFNRDEYPRIYFYAISIIEELREKKLGYEMIVRSLLHALYCELMRMRDSENLIGGEGTSKVYPFAAALNYISDNYTSRLYIDDLAKMCNLSTTHFRRVFLSVMGFTPHYFINTLRIEKACELLLTTSNSILSISEIVGFGSISSFNRCFLQTIGVSPRAYRNSRGVDERPQSRCILPYSGWTQAEDLSPNE